MQSMDIRKVVAAQSIQVIIESSVSNLHFPTNSEKRHIENNLNQHQLGTVGSYWNEVMLSLVSCIPSATKAEQSSIMIKMMLMLSHTKRKQNSAFPYYILFLMYLLRSWALFFIIHSDAYISIRKKINATSARVQEQQWGRVSNRQMTRDMSKRMLYSSTNGPILSTVVNIYYKCTVNPSTRLF